MMSLVVMVMVSFPGRGPARRAPLARPGRARGGSPRLAIVLPPHGPRATAGILPGCVRTRVLVHAIPGAPPAVAEPDSDDAAGRARAQPEAAVTVDAAGDLAPAHDSPSSSTSSA